MCVCACVWNQCECLQTSCRSWHNGQLESFFNLRTVARIKAPNNFKGEEWGRGGATAASWWRSPLCSALALDPCLHPALLRLSGTSNCDFCCAWGCKYLSLGHPQGGEPCLYIVMCPKTNSKATSGHSCKYTLYLHCTRWMWKARQWVSNPLKEQCWVLHWLLGLLALCSLLHYAHTCQYQLSLKEPLRLHSRPQESKSQLSVPPGPIISMESL